MTYRVYLDDGGLKLYPERDVGRADGIKKAQCPCGGWAFPQVMVDIRGFDNIMTDGTEFACGGCISSWERNLKPIEPGDKFLIRHEFRAKFIEIYRGVKDADAEAVKLEYLEREISKAIQRELIYGGEPDTNPEKIKLKARRLALEARIVKEQI